MGGSLADGYKAVISFLISGSGGGGGGGSNDIGNGSSNNINEIPLPSISVK